MNDLLDFEALRVTLASPEQIRSWSFGEVTKPETINYRTLKAERDGLFSENIFGPTKDYECYCGKYKRIRYRGVICDKCGVEVTQSRVRRERMGHITLASPVAHIWFVKGSPSKLSLILDIPPKSLEAVIYFASYLVVEAKSENKTKALDALARDLAAKLKAQAEALGKEIKILEVDLDKELVKQRKAFVKQKEKFELVRAEFELKTRQAIQKLRDNGIVESGQLESIYKAVTDLVKSVTEGSVLSEDEYGRLDEYGVSDFVNIGMGAEALLQALQNLNLDKLSVTLREEVRKSTGQRHIKATKRLRLVEGMRSAAVLPEWMVTRILPVLPPDLRPMVQLPGGRFATSDLNDLYRRVINRNNRLQKLINLGAPEIILRNEKRMLQEAVDALIDTVARTGRRSTDTHALRSLSDMLRGKHGRFRQNLLGKRVDYSGRSVIVVGPNLKLNQVGLPKEMALELFKPFVLREVIARGLASNVKGAKTILEHRALEVWDILEEIIEGHPILINRAPTLHRLGIQAFFPILVEGNAIQIHPCICAGFNADFDGDQMAVHVPLSSKAQEEAKLLMMAKENIFGPAHGQPVTIPNKEMALGYYFLTTFPEEEVGELHLFLTIEEAKLAYQVGKVTIRQKIKVIIQGVAVETSVGRILFNDVLPVGMRFLNIPVRGVTVRDIILRAMEIYSKDEVAEIIDRIKTLGFWGATIAGISVGVFDAKVVPNRNEYLRKAEDEIQRIEVNFAKGLITKEEKAQLSQEVWSNTTEELADATWGFFQASNPIRMIIEAGAARASRDQIKQISAMRGLSIDPTGKIVALPTKSNYRAGLSVFEYFTSCRGARKGVADKALKTADAGYLTRRLVDIAHGLIIRSEDCGTSEGMELILPKDNMQSAISRFLGRKVISKITDPKTKKVIVPADSYLTEAEISVAVTAGIDSIKVRSPLTCQAKYGMCGACYGLDLTTRKPVELGVPVGVVAAQSIGEPGTQLTMRTFHTGGIIGVDITTGLPRVEELFEVRTPKMVAPIAEIAGRVTIIEDEGGVKIRVRTTHKPHEEREYVVPASANILVEDGSLVASGTPLCGGHLDIREILSVKGLREAQKYIIDEGRAVYENTGVQINERHFEVIVKSMSDKVRIESQGDTSLLPGEVVDKLHFEEENNRVLASGGEPATAEIIILGITRASLQTESFLSAASFQETTTVLSEAAVAGKVDHLIGLKENVIIGRLIPTSPERAKME